MERQILRSGSNLPLGVIIYAETDQTQQREAKIEIIP